MAESHRASDGHPWPSERYGWYVTLVLLLAFTFSFVDRQVLNLLVEPIREDLGISDTQISFLQGMAFVLTYVGLSVPIGRMVDKYHRVRIMIGGVIVWSLTTIACGLSRSYPQFLVARMGVGAGEAALTPAAWSVLADYFRPERLSRPISVYLMGPYIGGGIAMIAGAEMLELTRDVDTIAVPLLGALKPWQFTFLAVGLPGILIVALLMTVSEPVRHGRMDLSAETPPWSEVLGFLREHWRLYLSLHIGIPFIVIMLYGLQAWTPTVLLRVFEWDLVQAGREYGVVALVAGSSGVLTGPVIARFLERRGYQDATLRIGVAAALAASISLVLMAQQTSAYAALACIAAASFFVTLPLALVTSSMQHVTPNAMRGVVSGMYVVSTNVIGLALGPTLVAFGTDFIFGDPRAVGKSLALVGAMVGPVAALLIWSGRKPFVRRLEELAAER